MEKQELLNQLSNWELKRSAYELMLSLAGFDQLTIAPKKGNEYRNLRVNLINDEYYKIVTDSKIIDCLLALKECDDLDFDTQIKVKKYLKDTLETSKIPANLFNAFNLAANESQQQWEISKQNNDYQSFEPHLRKMIEYKLQIAKFIQPNMDPYDYYLNKFEPGMDQRQYDAFFALIEKELVPLIEKVVSAQSIVDCTVLNKEVSIDKQEKLMHLMNQILGFDSSWGCMSVSMHPFTSGLCCNDVRVTTAYDVHDISSAIFSIIHEVGHATYEHQMNPQYDGTILKNVSSGMHESQSRLFENMLGRSESFWKPIYSQLQTITEVFKDVSLTQFVQAINASKPSLIRTDADELTYPIHILIRYQLEKALMHGQYKNQPLNEVWNDYYKKYLGVTVENDAQGILQDVHWSDGSFGYFPTYALGSAVAAQLMHTMRLQMDVDSILENNQFAKINEWLKENVHKYGNTLEMNDILLKVTGEKFNPLYYINYLKDKYIKLYQLDK